MKQPLRNWWLTALLILVNCLLFGYQVMQGMSFTDPDIVDLIHWGADFGPLTLTRENWRLLSSMFLHIGITHLLFNMWALYLFGVYAEFYYPRLWYVVIYLLAGIAGGLASNVVNLQHAFEFLQHPDRDLVPSVGAGASGAIMGLGGALLVAALWPKQDLAPIYRLNKNGLIILMLINLSLGLFVAGINDAAHVGGFIAGTLLALGYRVSLVWSSTVRYALQVVFIMMGIALAVWIDYGLSQQAQQVMAFWSMYLQ